MIGGQEVSRYLFGAWLLAKYDRNGAYLFDNTPEAFWRSFWAAFVVFPAFAILLLLRSAHVEINVGAFWAFFIQATAYAMGWVAFPYIVFHVLRLFDAGENFCRYIAAYNWARVLEITLMLGVTALVAGGIVPRELGNILTIIAIVAILAYEGFVAHAALEVPAAGAVGLVFLDLLLSLTIQGWSDRLLAGQPVIGG
jgi:hypothetical protein